VHHNLRTKLNQAEASKQTPATTAIFSDSLRIAPPGNALSSLAGGMIMSTYVFLCQDCNKEFTKSLHMADVEKVGVECPHCGSKRVLQAVASFSAVTPRKS
jgi:putative FmdB family regulatory protein